MSKITAWILIIGLVFGFFCGLFTGYAAISQEPDEYSNLMILTIIVPWMAIGSFPFYAVATIIELVRFFRKK